MNIAIITARGGSKRIPRKNIRLFRGKPMIAWSIEAALASKCFAHVLVSTDDEEIADVAKRYGARVPFLRPANLADDYAPAHKAARHALEWAIETYGNIKIFCHLYATAPLLDAATLVESIRKIQSDSFKSIWAVTQIPYPVYQIMIKNEAGGLSRLFSKNKVCMRSQDMPPAYIDVGQFYTFDVKHFLKNEMSLSNAVGFVEVPQDTALDIDTEADWMRAEKMAEKLFSNPNS